MRRRSLQFVNVVDVEATCWEGEPPPGERSEIIEVGIARLDVATLTIAEHRGILVRPRASRVSAYCTRLTTLTQEDVDAGIEFVDVCSHLRRSLDSRNMMWASYGDYDRQMFEAQCRDFGVPYPFGSRHLNVKTLAGLALGLDAEVGMDRALALLGLPLEGTHHRGGDDARNIARILARILQVRSG